MLLILYLKVGQEIEVITTWLNGELFLNEKTYLPLILSYQNDYVE